jgi:hypothetical protein
VQLFGRSDSFFVSPAHFSARDGRHELITESDYTGTLNTHHFDHRTTPLANTAPSLCSNPGIPAGYWDTNGGFNQPGAVLNERLAFAATCDIPNWLNYGFRGSVSVGTDWSLTSWDAFRGPGRPAPQLTRPDDRRSCRVLMASTGITAPSCDSVSRTASGDWLETVPLASSDLPAVRDAMRSFIRTYGRGAPGAKAVVVNVFVWDCAQQYVPPSTPPWHLLHELDDCSSVRADVEGVEDGRSRMDRLHVVAVVPMTIGETQVQIVAGELQVFAQWGGLFGDAGACSTAPTLPACALNPVMNSAFLVPGE